MFEVIGRHGGPHSNSKVDGGANDLVVKILPTDSALADRWEYGAQKFV